MADILWTNANNDGVLEESNNWVSADSGGNSTSGQTDPPGPGDNAWIDGSSSGPMSVGTLTCDALSSGPNGQGTIAGGTYETGVYDNQGPISITGGTFNQFCSFENGTSPTGGTFNSTMDIGSNINGGTYNGSITFFGSLSISAGTFNCPVTTPGSGMTISGGTFNDSVDVVSGDTVTGGVFNAQVSSDGGFNLTTNPAGVFNGPVYVEGYGPFYTSSALAAAPANKVLAGTSNLGVPGTASAGIPTGVVVAGVNSDKINGVQIPYMVATVAGTTLVTP